MAETPEFKALRPLVDSRETRDTDRVIMGKLGTRWGAKAYANLLENGVDMAELEFDTPLKMSSLRYFLHADRDLTWWDLIDYFLSEFTLMETQFTFVETEHNNTQVLRVLDELKTSLRAYRELLTRVVGSLPGQPLRYANRASNRRALMNLSVRGMLRRILDRRPAAFWRAFWQWVVVDQEEDEVAEEDTVRAHQEAHAESRGDLEREKLLLAQIDPRLVKTDALEPRKERRERALTAIYVWVLPQKIKDTPPPACLEAFRQLTREHHVLQVTRDVGCDLVRALLPNVIEREGVLGTVYLKRQEEEEEEEEQPLPRSLRASRKRRVLLDDDDDDEPAVAASSNAAARALVASVNGLQIVDDNEAPGALTASSVNGMQIVVDADTKPGIHDKKQQAQCLKFLDDVIEQTPQYTKLPPVPDGVSLDQYLGDGAASAYALVCAKPNMRSIAFREPISDPQILAWVQSIRVSRSEYASFDTVFSKSFFGVLRALVVAFAFYTTSERQESDIARSILINFDMRRVNKALAKYEALLQEVIPGYCYSRNALRRKLTVNSPALTHNTTVLAMLQNAERFCAFAFWKAFWYWAIQAPNRNAPRDTEADKSEWEQTALLVYHLVCDNNRTFVLNLRFREDVQNGLMWVMQKVPMLHAQTPLRPVGLQLIRELTPKKKSPLDTF